MNAALWGCLTALGWGMGDFVARYTGSALGPAVALTAMLTASALGLTLLVPLVGHQFVFPSSGLIYLVASGLGVSVATLLLYWGLARGPVSIVAPIVGSFPAFNLALAVIQGERPSGLEWLLMAGVMSGVVIVARAGSAFEGEGRLSRAALRGTIAAALTSSVLFALTVAALEAAAPYYGELQAVALGRWIGAALALVIVLVLHRGSPPAIPLRWWPLLLLQGSLDGGAYVALAIGTQSEGGVITTVVGSGFSAVTVILARVVLREPMTAAQWGGVGLIVSGVAVLSGLR
jgi:drug/metabolite transporter (DMT)-like permease